MRAGVIVFPGSNCDRDVKTALDASFSEKAVMVWHKETSLPKLDLIVLPGGFSYGDYLRCGAMAARSPIMREVVAHAEKGGYVLGVCNGFQVLTESGLLPGALLRNKGLRFICRDVFLKVESNDNAFSSRYREGQVVKFPIAHHDGNYFATKETLSELEGEGRVAFRYSDEKGGVAAENNPNGSMNNIAGILNGKKNVLGLMPHPERLAEKALGGEDGRIMFEALAGK